MFDENETKVMTRPSAKATSTAGLLSPVEAAYHLGITAELIFQYTKPSFAKATGLRPLATIEVAGKTRLSRSELDSFNALLADPWPEANETRTPIPRAILDHLRGESRNQCARCGSGIGVETAHIRPWATSRSHHHDNLIRICVSCHKEHDVHRSLPMKELQALKASLIERTRASLRTPTGPTEQRSQLPAVTPNFVGREGALAELKDCLCLGRSIMITGVGGIGKTQLLIKSLTIAETGRPIIWIDVGKYDGLLDVFAALQSAVGDGEIACSIANLSTRLDEMRACVVFDGVEQSTLEEIDDFEDGISALMYTGMETQFVFTSQIALYRLETEKQITLGRLDGQSSKTLVENIAGSQAFARQKDFATLLAFCDGHSLTLRLAGALLKHYGEARLVLSAIDRKGAVAITLPGRQRHDHTTSLQLCLLIAHESLSSEARRLLSALAECPAGLFTHWILSKFLALNDPAETLGELRQWHLVDTVELQGNVTRTSVLSPVRTFVRTKTRETDLPAHADLTRDVIIEFAVLAAILETEYDHPYDTPYVLERFREELPNFLHTLILAREFANDTDLVRAATAIVRSLMRYFFVRGLFVQGARAMRDAAELALKSGQTKDALALLLQFAALAQRAGEQGLMQEVSDLVDRIETQTTSEEEADLALCRSMVAAENGDNEGASTFARAAVAAYQRALFSLPIVEAEEGRNGNVECRNEISNVLASAFGLLGSALLASGEPAEAAKAYNCSLHHQRGASIAVNRGQTLHQLGNCCSHVQRFDEAAKHYLDAAEVFHFVGMEEFLSNALGELGYAVLDVKEEHQIDVDRDLLLSGLEDLSRSVKSVFDLAKPLDHFRCISIIRKLFGSIALLSITGYGEHLEELCAELKKNVIDPFGCAFAEGQRDRDELFPVMIIELSSRVGLLVARSEESFRQDGDVAEDIIDELVVAICQSHQWAQDQMRLVDWLAIFLTRRWKFSGVSPKRLHEFVQNFRDGVVDSLNLSREER